MKALLRKTYTLTVFNLVLRMLAPLAKRPILSRPVRIFMRILAWTVHWSSGSPTASSPESLAQVWQRLMPSSREFPIPGDATFASTAQNEFLEKTTAEFALGQIHLHCPLRGSDNRHACHQLMEFDRELMRRSGGELHVLDSQSESGRAHCTVGIEIRKP